MSYPQRAPAPLLYSEPQQTAQIYSAMHNWLNQQPDRWQSNDTHLKDIVRDMGIIYNMYTGKRPYQAGKMLELANSVHERRESYLRSQRPLILPSVPLALQRNEPAPNAKPAQSSFEQLINEGKFDQITSLTEQEAQKVVNAVVGQGLSSRRTLRLDKLTTLSPEVARVLVKYPGDISLRGITTFGADKENAKEIAAILATHKGPEIFSGVYQNKTLALGLTAIEPEVASALCKHPGALYLENLNHANVSQDVIKSFANFRTDVMFVHREIEDRVKKQQTVDKFQKDCCNLASSLQRTLESGDALDSRQVKELTDRLNQRIAAHLKEYPDDQELIREFALKEIDGRAAVYYYWTKLYSRMEIRFDPAQSKFSAQQVFKLYADPKEKINPEFEKYADQSIEKLQTYIGSLTIEEITSNPALITRQLAQLQSLGEGFAKLKLSHVYSQKVEDLVHVWCQQAIVEAAAEAGNFQSSDGFKYELFYDKEAKKLVLRREPVEL